MKLSWIPVLIMTLALAWSCKPKKAAVNKNMRQKSEVETTASGLKFQDIKVGKGASPKPGQRVTVHYTGWLTNGKMFDSSKKRNRPYTFPIGQRRVIRGWDEGVMTMRIGGKRKLIIPHHLAYGVMGRPPVIPPKATLIFEVELLGIR